SELRKVIPSFLQRVDLPDRGGDWSAYLAETRDGTRRAVDRLLHEDGGDRDGISCTPAPAEVILVDFDPDGEDKVLAAIAFEHGDLSEHDALERVRRLSADDRRALLTAYVGDRTNRRHRPGRAFERTGYRFELVTDYGAFRDLQRHRILTIDWQPLSAGLGYDLPDLVQETGEADTWTSAMERSADLHAALSSRFAGQAAYAIALAFRVRYVMQMNARETMHVVELRSGPQGHPSYRRVAQQMHQAIDRVAGHRLIAGAMSYVDHGDGGLGRLDALARASARHPSPNGNGRPNLQAADQGTLQ
ncbi:MAG: FAD-dependent thymidylate synthase, partial [Solirubrobacteraceae bacterium]